MASLKDSPGKRKYVSFQVGQEYELLKTIGSGSYGVVCSAVVVKTKQNVAIKKISNPFEVLTTAKRTLRELKLLLHFNHDNIVGIKDVIHHENSELFQDVYLVMDLMESDLHHVIRSPQTLTEEHVLYFLYQLLRGLKYIHSANVIHRDLKPSNLLVNKDCELKIGDFGMAKGLSASPDHRNFMTDYVATRWYRAPELMLSLAEYGTAIDMWSVGCILAELINRKQLFPGRHYVDQLHLIISVLGSPSNDLVASIRSERVRSYVLKLPAKQPVSLQDMCPKASPQLVNLLVKLLEFDPSRRITAIEALSHQVLSGYHDNDDEPICQQKFDFKFDDTAVTKQDVKLQVMNLISDYHAKKAKLHQQFVFSIPDQKSDDDFKKPIGIVAKKPATKVSEDKAAETEEGKKQSDKPEAEEDVTEASTTVVESAPPKTTGRRGRKGGSGLKTISESTKVLVRDTILASMLAKKNGLGKPSERPKKPVTAAERQREREEKRKKRQERAQEKERKKKEAQAKKNSPGLTEQDKTLLQRWSNMQQKPTNTPESSTSNESSQGLSSLSRTNSLPSNTSPPHRHAQENQDPVTPRRWSMNEMLPSNDNSNYVPMLPNVPASPMATDQSIVTVVVDQSMQVPQMPPLIAIDPKRNTGGHFIKEKQPVVEHKQQTTDCFIPERPNTLGSFATSIKSTTSGLTPLSAMVTSFPQTPSNFTQSCDKKLVNLSPGTVDLILNEEFDRNDDSMGVGDLSLKSLSFKTPPSTDDVNVLSISPGGTSLIVRSKEQPANPTNSFVQQQSSLPTTNIVQSSMSGIIPAGNFTKDFERYESSAQSLQESNKLYSSSLSSPTAGSKFYNGQVLLSESQLEEPSVAGGHFVPVYEEENSFNQINGLNTEGATNQTSGVGYGLGSFIEEPTYDRQGNIAMDLGSATSSSSILANWIELNQISYDEIDQLQRELELGSPMDLL